MDEDELEDLSSGRDDFEDSGFMAVLQVFEDSSLVDPHHNCGVSELFESKDSFEGQVIYYVRSGSGERIIGSIQFFYNEWLWRGFAEEYKGQIDFQTSLLEMLYSEQEFKSLVDTIGTEYMMAVLEERAIDLEIPGEPDIEVIKKTLQRFVELSEFFHSRVSNETGPESFRGFTEND